LEIIDGGSGGVGKVQDALQGLALVLQDRSRNILGDLEKRIKRACKCRGAIEGNLANRVELLKFKLERLEEQRNLYWRPRVKVHWLDKGDRNTKFFHQYATERKRKSRIRRIVLDDSRVMEEEGDLLGAVTDFYPDF
jgi:hypothetical protein